MMFTMLPFLSLLSYLAYRANSQILLCDDASECAGQTIANTAQCYGYLGCDDADISNSYTYAYGYQSNTNSSVTTNFLYSYGYNSGYGAEIAGNRVYGYGYRSLKYADIEANDQSLFLYAYGLEAAENSDVLCYSGHTCSIYCGNSFGCRNMNFYCYSDATCYYDCSGDQTCPTLYGGIGSTLQFAIDKSTTKTKDISRIHEENHYLSLTNDQITEYYLHNREIKLQLIEKEQQKHKHGYLDAMMIEEEEREAASLVSEDIMRQAFKVDMPLNKKQIETGEKFVYDNKYVWMATGAIGMLFVRWIIVSIIHKCFKNNDGGYDMLYDKQPLLENHIVL